MALHATTIRFADRSYVAVARAADAQGISVSQYVREAALIRAVLDELDTAEEALHTAHDLLAVAREVRQLAQVDPPARRDQTPTSGPAPTRGVTRPSRQARKWRSRFETTTRSAAVRWSHCRNGPARRSSRASLLRSDKEQCGRLCPVPCNKQPADLIERGSARGSSRAGSATSDLSCETACGCFGRRVPKRPRIAMNSPRAWRSRCRRKSLQIRTVGPAGAAAVNPLIALHTREVAHLNSPPPLSTRSRPKVRLARARSARCSPRLPLLVERLGGILGGARERE